MFEHCGRRTDGRTDGRTMYDGRQLDAYTISSPCEPNGSGELINNNGLASLWLHSKFHGNQPNRGQGHSRVIIYINYDGQESPMLQTKFRENRPAGSGEEDF